MKETVRKLWSGEIRPLEEKIIDKGREKEIYNKINLLKNKLLEENKVHIEVLNEIDDTYGRLSSFLQEEGFIRGFSLAVKLFLEIKNY